ncbi:MAG: hypothetical protein Q8S04_11585 [Bacteroidales bacterium]|nr:hypothetical protein [Bacteroidales bacterium]
MGKESRYKFVSSPFFLGLYLIFMLVTSFILSDGLYNYTATKWIPLFAGLIDTESITTTISVLTTTAIISFTAFSLYYVNEKIFSCGKSSSSLFLIYLILLLSSPETIFFSGATAAAPLFLWSLYYSMITKEGDKNLFMAMFLISLATLFDFHAVVLLPFILYYSLITSSFALRALLIALGAILVPYILTFSFRYLMFNDTSLFAELLVSDFLSLSPPYIRLESVAKIVLVIFMVLIISRSLISIFSIISRYKVVKSIGLVRNITVMLVLIATMLIYRESQGMLTNLLALPLSFIIVEYLSLKSTNKYRRVEFFVLLIIIVLNRVAQFV